MNDGDNGLRWYDYVAFFLAGVAMMLVLGTCMAVKPEGAWGHSKAITECTNNIRYNKAVLMREGIYEGQIAMWQGFYAEIYDTNDDGVPDIMALSHVVGVEQDERGGPVVYRHDPNPVYWIVDIYDEEGMPGRDGYPDAIYIDKMGLGNCDDIGLYKDIRGPNDPSLPNYDARPNAKV